MKIFPIFILAVVLVLLLSGCIPYDEKYCTKFSQESCDPGCALCPDSLKMDFNECHSKEFCKNLKDEELSSGLKGIP